METSRPLIHSRYTNYRKTPNRVFDDARNSAPYRMERSMAVRGLIAHSGHPPNFAALVLRRSQLNKSPNLYGLQHHGRQVEKQVKDVHGAGEIALRQQAHLLHQMRLRIYRRNCHPDSQHNEQKEWNSVNPAHLLFSLFACAEQSPNWPCRLTI